MEWRHPSIIAVTGPPFTGRTSIAFELSLHLRHCSLLRLDDILDPLSRPSSSSSSRPPPPHEADQLSAQAFDILCRLVDKQLSLGLSVILDSPFSSRPQLDRLVRLSAHRKASKFVIVQCRIERAYAWQQRFERRDEHDDRYIVLDCPDQWFKPQSWEDVAKHIEAHDPRLDEPVPGVSALLLNVDKPQRGRHIIQALQALVFCQEDRRVDYGKWVEYNVSIKHQYKYHDHEQCHGESCSKAAEKELINLRLRNRVGFCIRNGRGHSITIFHGQGLDYDANCGVCESPVLGPAYTCNACLLAIHKSCAEKSRSFTPQEFPTFVSKSDPPDYSFPENHTCLVCKEQGREFSTDCQPCIFESHMKCGLIPTIIDHDCHEHKLFFWAMPFVQGGRYKCEACGLDGMAFAYSCSGCQKSYHVECALLPYPLMHKHGGYEHPLEMRFSRDTEQEDYPCDFCFEMMNPEDWYYHCPKCYQTYHLHCAFADHHNS